MKFKHIIGVLIFPDTCNPVSDIRTAWIGTSVSAGWAYFVPEPQKN